MKKAKCIAAAAVAAMMSLTTASCGNYSIHKSIEIPTEIRFSWWGSDNRTEYTLTAITNYEKEHSDIDITPYSGDFVGYKENLDALFSSGKESDVVQINYSWLKQYSPDGEGFYDLSELDSYIDLDNFSEEELSYGMVNGKLNAIPISLNAVTFYYNQTLFDRYGLAIPETWDDLFTCAEVFSEDGIYTLVTADIYCWLMLTAHEEQISGKSAFSEGAAAGFDEQNIRSMMEFLKELIDKQVMPYGEPYDRADFICARSAGEVLWVSDAEYYAMPLETEGDGEITVGNYLTADGSMRSGWYVKPTSLYAISKNTENPKKAAEFLNYLLNDKNVAVLQGAEKGVPLSRSALETLDANNMLYGASYDASRKLSENSSELNQMPAELENSERYGDFFAEFDLYYYGQKSLDDAAKDYIEKWQF